MKKAYLNEKFYLHCKLDHNFSISTKINKFITTKMGSDMNKIQQIIIFSRLSFNSVSSEL